MPRCFSMAANRSSTLFFHSSALFNCTASLSSMSASFCSALILQLRMKTLFLPRKKRTQGCGDPFRVPWNTQAPTVRMHAVRYSRATSGHKPSGPLPFQAHVNLLIDDKEALRFSRRGDLDALRIGWALMHFDQSVFLQAR